MLNKKNKRRRVGDILMFSTRGLLSKKNEKGENEYDFLVPFQKALAKKRKNLIKRQKYFMRKKNIFIDIEPQLLKLSG
jgi:hypothetical protein